MSGPRVHNGREWIPISSTVESSDVKPVEPVLDGDGKIFVSIVSYRGMLSDISYDIYKFFPQLANTS